MTRSLRTYLSRLFFGDDEDPVLFRDHADPDTDSAYMAALEARDVALRWAQRMSHEAAIVGGLLGHLREQVANLRAERNDLRAELADARRSLDAANAQADKANAAAAEYSKMLKMAKVELLRRPMRPDRIDAPARSIAAGTVEAVAAGLN